MPYSSRLLENGSGPNAGEWRHPGTRDRTQPIAKCRAGLSQDVVCLDRPHGYYQSRCHWALPARQLDPGIDRRRRNARHHCRRHSPIDDDRHRRRALGRTRQPDFSNELSHHAQRLVQKRGRELHWSQRGNNLCPWVPRGRCLPRGRVHRARPVDHSQWQRKPAHQALLIVGRERIVGRGA